MEFIYSDGGRSKYFKASGAGDCVCRAICNATGNDYKETYKALSKMVKECNKSKHNSARDGVPKIIVKKYIEEVLGWKWVPCMTIGSGCTTHLRDGELPYFQKIIVNLSGHLSCVENDTIYDTYDCSRDGNRCVYGYWIIKES